MNEGADMENKWIVTFAKLYFIVIVIVNLGFTTWANYKSYRFEMEYKNRTTIGINCYNKTENGDSNS